MTTALAAFPIPSGTSKLDIRHEDWLAARLLGVGASEIADVCGFGYGSPLAVYLRKTGAMPPLEESLAMRIGTLAEPIIRQLYEEATGCQIAREQVFAHRPEFPGLFATLDALTDEGHPVEFKCVGHRQAHRWGPSGTDEVPDHYLLQATQQMMVAGTDSLAVAAFLGTDFRVYEVHRDPAAEQLIVRHAAEFLDRLARRDPPPPSEPTDADLMVFLHPEAAGEVALDADGDHLARSFLDLGDRIRADERERKTLKAQIEAAMGDAALARLTDGRALTRRVVTPAAGTRTVKVSGDPYSVLAQKRGKGAERGEDE